MAITVGLVEAVDSNGVYVSMPGTRGVLRGPYQATAQVLVGQRALLTSTDDGEVVVGGVIGEGQGVSVKAFGAKGDGVTDDTSAIQDAIDAVHDLGGGTVHLPQGTYRITGGGLQSRSAFLVGAGARSLGTSTAAATILQGDSQTGPVLTIEGTGGIGTGGNTDQFFGMRGVESLTIRGDGSSDEYGLYLHNAHMITVRNVAIRNCRGVPLFADRAYFVTVEDSQVQEPVGASTNDTPYVELHQANSWRVRGLLLHGLSSGAPTVGASGAVIITDDGSFDSTASDYQFLTEFMTMAEGSVGIIDHQGNSNRIELTAWDSEDYGSVTTPWAAIRLSAGLNDYGANIVTGQLLAKYAAGNRTCYGVRLEQGNNAVLATPGYPSESVYIASGVQHCRVELMGSNSGPGAGQVVDASGNATNQYVDILTARFPQTSMGFFGAAPTTKPTVTGSKGGNAALGSLLTALANLGLITDSSS
jgi:hypothetical protein